MTKERNKQAVIVIHGMGEQEPMDTIRGFVDAVLDEPESGEKYYSKPDKMSESFELRRLQSKLSEPRSDFFEYYWAHKVKGTTISHVLGWAISLLLRSPCNLPSHILKYYLFSWFLISILVLFVLLGVFDVQGLIDLLEAGYTFSIAGAAFILLGIIQKSLASSVGDAVRYLSPKPENIDIRNSIRADGIKLLRNIHERGKYDRVIVVGHSLGSIIAYDILAYLWQEYYQYYSWVGKHDQPALKDVEKKGKDLSLKRKQPKIEDFQDSQYRLWQELRNLGNPWLVTDLITAGSPLYHAAVLLAKNEKELEKHQKQLELPKCPPISDPPEKNGVKEDVEKDSYSYIPIEIKKPFKAGGRSGHSVATSGETAEIVSNAVFKLRGIHHAGHFAFVRWTNIYFPTKYLFFGDLVGGPIRKWFGAGIKDVAVTTSKWRGVAKCTPKAHSCYWWPPDKDSKKEKGKPLALKELIKALDLKCPIPE